MNDGMITFRSITPAQRGEGLLRRKGIRCTLRRTPKKMEQRGCGYSLRLPYKDINTALMLLKDHGIAYGKVYMQQPNGLLEELSI